MKGLLTEHSELNFPQDASIDELNCSLHRAGNRTRRLGIEYEDGFQLSGKEYNGGQLVGVTKWTNVGDDPDLDYLVVQVGSTLLFYRRGSGALSSGLLDYEVDLVPYEKEGGLGASASHVETASINGYLVVVSPQIEAFYIERDSGGNFTESTIDFKIRDFKYLSPREPLMVDEEPPGTPERFYDSLNCGWVGDRGVGALEEYVRDVGDYPALSHPWYSGKNADGNFAETEWQEVYSGTSLIVNGHFILDLFNQNRVTGAGMTEVDSASSDWNGVTDKTSLLALIADYEADPATVNLSTDDIESTVITDRFSAVAAYAGRVFFGGVGTRVYFSRLLESITDIGNFYQVNDPTAETISDLLDTDGGWIDIPEASGIKKLHVFGSSLLVFANNGVWKVSGVDEVFRATEFSVYRVTDEGLAYRKSFVSGQNAIPFWWSYNGIQTVQVTDQGGLVAQNISRDTIQGFWEGITPTAKSYVQGVYDGQNDRALWMYPDNGEATAFKLNNILLLDLTLGAFYPWSISDLPSQTPYVLSGAYFDESGTDTVEYTVVDSTGAEVVDSSGNTVVVERDARIAKSSSVSLLTRTPSGALTFSTFTKTSFLDWGEADYTSFAESAYNFQGDLSRRKNAPYITAFLRVTETGWEDQGGGAYALVRPSSIKMSSFWDFSTSSSSSPQQLYRFKYPLVMSSEDFEYPTTVITTRVKTRGRGRVLRLRFESETGKDFNLLGWETIGARNSTL